MKRSRNHRSITCRSASLEPLEPRQMLAAGALDKSFSGDGKATVTLDNFTLIAEDVAVQADGKTVMVGTATRNVSPPDPFFALARLNLDGTPDTAFGGDGFAAASGIRFSKLNTNVGQHFARAVAIQPDGKIIVAGTLGDEWAVARFLPNGNLDLSFSGDGVQTIGFNSTVGDVAVQSDGKIVVVGSHSEGIFNINLNFAIARLNPNGSLDNSFDGDGKKQIQFGDDEFAEAVAFDSTGRIIVAGLTIGAASGARMALTRLRGADGSVDTTFGTGGLVRTAFPGRTGSSANKVLIQSGTKIVVAGSTGVRSDSNGIDFVVGRYLATGQLDTTFGAARTGLVTVDFGGSDLAFGVIQSANGGLVVAGNTNGKFALAGLTAGGLIDNNFGTLGKVVTDVGGGGRGVLAKGPGRRFVVAGGSNFKAARYLDTGANVVSVGAIDPDASEGAGGFGNGGLIVGRIERLPVSTRVFFSIGGTATRPSVFRNIITGEVTIFGDYTLSGMSSSTVAGGTFVDIPANQTFVVVTITARDDTALEGTESAVFTIIPNASYEIGTPSSGKIDIADNEIGITTNLPGASDSYVRDGTSANTSFSSAADLQVKTDAVGFNRLSYIKFDISSLSGIVSAKLNLFGKISDSQNTNVLVNLFSVADTSWTGPTLTFNNRPAPGATPLTSVTVTDATLRLYEFDVTNYVKQEKALGRTFVSFMLQSPATTAAFVSFTSGNAASNQPKLTVLSTGVGTSVLTPGAVNLPKNGKVTYKLEWTHPGVWRDLDTIELRIVNDAGVLAWIKWDETTNAISLRDPKTGQFSRSGQPGSRRKLKAGNVVLDLRHSSVVGTGPLGPSVTVTLALKLKVREPHGSHAPLKYRVEVFASDDNGNRQGFEPAGTLRVLSKAKGRRS